MYYIAHRTTLILRGSNATTSDDFHGEVRRSRTGLTKNASVRFPPNGEAPHEKHEELLSYLFGGYYNAYIYIYIDYTYICIYTYIYIIYLCIYIYMY